MARFVFTDPQTVEAALNALSLTQEIHFPMPGNALDFQGSATDVKCERLDSDWIVVSHLRDSDLDETSSSEHWFCKAIFGQTNSPEDLARAIHEIARELQTMAPVFMLSDVGRLATASHHYVGGPTGEHRFAIRFYDDLAGYVTTAALNINSCHFDWLARNEGEIFTSVPFGIDVHVKDFIELLSGGIQIWELATARMRQWHLGIDKIASPVGFLYSYFSEQVRPEIAAAMYRKIWSEDLSIFKVESEVADYA